MVIKTTPFNRPYDHSKISAFKGVDPSTLSEDNHYEYDRKPELMDADKFLHKGLEDLFLEDPTLDENGEKVGIPIVGGEQLPVILDHYPGDEELDKKYGKMHAKLVFRVRHGKVSGWMPDNKEDFLTALAYGVLHVSVVKVRQAFKGDGQKLLRSLFNMICYQEDLREGCEVNLPNIVASMVNLGFIGQKEYDKFAKDALVVVKRTT